MRVDSNGQSVVPVPTSFKTLEEATLAAERMRLKLIDVADRMIENLRASFSNINTVLGQADTWGMEVLQNGLENHLRIGLAREGLDPAVAREYARDILKAIEDAQNVIRDAQSLVRHADARLDQARTQSTHAAAYMKVFANKLENQYAEPIRDARAEGAGSSRGPGIVVN